MELHIEGTRIVTKDQLGEFFDIAGRASYAHVQGKGLPGHMRDDLTQEGLLWLLDHPARVENARLPDKTLYGSRLVAEIRRYYVASGVDRPPGSTTDATEDGTYTVAMLALVLPAVYDPEYTPFREQTEAGERFAERDPSETGTWMALIADASSAVDAFGRDNPEYQVVFRHDVLHESFADIARSEGSSDFPVRKRYREVMEWMVDWLNGDRYEVPEPE